jgi:hypothetical protein
MQSFGQISAADSRQGVLAGRLSDMRENPRQQTLNCGSNGSYHTGSPLSVKLANRHKPAENEAPLRSAARPA